MILNKQLIDFQRLSSEDKKAAFSGELTLIKELVASLIDKKRYDHSLSVAALAKDLAANYGFDQNKAYLMGILHDITKSFKKEDHLYYFELYDPDKINCPLPIMHSYSAKYFLMYELSYCDEEVLDAIYHHTDGESARPLAMILYIADKRDPLRKIDDGILKQAYIDLSSAFEWLKEDVREYVEKKNGKVS